ncbi:hypothetical protein GN958_ATG08062 [Phytophthora infestans]|uniref:Uncharacterized protein n=1 Tax=Phytophthora infestans TaxID=4787 RepID=A0A8S9UPT9_PHYIN|nr:hypothetical protein GN958_ATG08062 [Phytophthora infestans]
MPRALPWTELVVGLNQEDIDLLLGSFKSYIIVKSDHVPCTVCTNAVPHNMRKRLLRCACNECKAAMPYAGCEWRGKLLKCEQEDLLDLFKVGSHVSTRRSLRPPRITRAMQSFANEMADQVLKPARIRTGLMRKFKLGLDTLPPLKVVQRFVYNYLA